MGIYDDLSFVVRSGNRRRVFELLQSKKTPTEIAKDLNLNVGYVSNLIIDLLERKLIECLSPNEKRHRFYIITSKGKKLLQEMK